MERSRVEFRFPVRCRVRTAGAVAQSLLAFGPPAAHPLVSGDAGDAHLGGDMRDGASGADTFYQQPPAVNGQTGITVGHEDLRAVKTRHLHHTGGLRHDQARQLSTTLVINTPSACLFGGLVS